MMRIITGRARGTKLSSPKGENTRPTAERTKEAVFSMLQFDLAGKEILDLFAGSGQMGLEALSRGAAHATLCDRSREAIEVIRANALKTRLAPMCDVVCSDHASLLRSLRRKKQMDIVFLDPPYALGLVPESLRMLVEYGLLRNGAKLVCETAAPEDVFSSDGWLAAHFEILRATHYGVAYVTILQYKTHDGEE